VSVAPIRAKPDDEAIELLRVLLAEVRELRREVAELRRAPSAPALVAALREFFGASGRLTAATVLTMAERESRLWDALIESGVDLEASAQSRLIAVGMLLARMPELELVARRRGGAIYRLRD
jgi:hypothetical protein